MHVYRQIHACVLGCGSNLVTPRQGAGDHKIHQHADRLPVDRPTIRQPQPIRCPKVQPSANHPLVRCPTANRPTDRRLTDSWPPASRLAAGQAMARLGHGLCMKIVYENTEKYGMQLGAARQHRCRMPAGRPIQRNNIMDVYSISQSTTSTADAYFGIPFQHTLKAAAKQPVLSSPAQTVWRAPRADMVVL